MQKKRKLVVIGNGMAGARTVEEILARGGGRPVRHHHVRRRAHRELQPHSAFERAERLVQGRRDLSESACLVRGKQHHACWRACGPSGLLRRAKLVYGEDGHAEPYDKLIIATGSRPFIPPMEGTTMPDGSFKPGVFVFRTLDDCREIAAYAQGKKSAAVIGGGLLGLEAARGLQNFGLEVNVVHLGGHLMQQQLDPSAGAILKTSMEKLGVKVLLKKNTTAILGPDRVLGSALRRRQHARMRHGGDLRRDQGQLGNRGRLRADRGARNRGRRSDALRRRSRHLRGGRMRAASRPDVRPGGAAVGAGQGAGRSHHRKEHPRGLSRLEGRDQAQGDGRGGGVDGNRGAARSRGRSGSILRAQTRHVQEADHPRRPAGGRHSAGRYQQGGLSDAGVRPQYAACRKSGCGCCSISAIRPSR